METKEFILFFEDYKQGNPEPLSNYILSKKSIDIFEWFYLSELVCEKKVLNMDVGSFYIPGTLHIFTDALRKINTKTQGFADINSKLSPELLSESKKEAQSFIDILYQKKNPFKSLVFETIGWESSVAATFWEFFHIFFLEKIEAVQEDKILNFSENIDYILKKDPTTIIRLHTYIEYPGTLASELNWFKEIINYSLKYDNYILPKYDLLQYGRNEESLEQLQKIWSVIHKAELELNLGKTTGSTKKIKL